MWARRAVLFSFVLAMGMRAVSAQTPKSLLVPESGLPAMKNVAVFGQKIAYYDAGSVPVVVLVHGFGSRPALIGAM